MDDKRQRRRIKADFQVELVPEVQAVAAKAGALEDCSTSGLRVWSESALSRGQCVRVLVRDNRVEGEAMDLGVAEVMWTQAASGVPGSADGSRMGLKFLDPDSDTVQRVFIAAQTQDLSRRRAAERIAAQRNKACAKKAWL
jgi:hypothetical protein